MIKSLSSVQETQVWSLSQEDPLEKEMATHSSILAWKIPWTVEPGRLQSMGSQRVGQDWATSLEQKSNRAFSRHNRTHPNCGLLYRPGPGGPESTKRKREKERERAVSLGLHGKPIKPIYRTCTAHEGTGHPLKEVLKTRARKWAWQASMLRREWRQKEGHGGPRSLVEQGYFISRNAVLYIFSKMITQLLKRMKFHQLQQNG